jgi:hypothetical protein
MRHDIRGYIPKDRMSLDIEVVTAAGDFFLLEPSVRIDGWKGLYICDLTAVRLLHIRLSSWTTGSKQLLPNGIFGKHTFEWEAAMIPGSAHCRG